MKTKQRGFFIFTILTLTIVCVSCNSEENSAKQQVKQQKVRPIDKQMEVKQQDMRPPKITPEPSPINIATPSPKITTESETKNQNQDQKSPIEAYLTFDDGPSKNTIKILDALRSYKIKATFFVNGDSSETGKELYKKILDEGHAIGLHAYSHDYDKIYTSVSAFEQDHQKLVKLLEDTIGVRPNIMRFPGGSDNTVSHKSGGSKIMHEIIKAMTQQDYQFFDWNVDSTDAKGSVQNKKNIVNSVLKESEGKNQIIVLMHDSDEKTTTVQALPVLIEKLKGRGYEFKVITKDSFNFKLLKR